MLISKAYYLIFLNKKSRLKIGFRPIDVIIVNVYVGIPPVICARFGWISLNSWRSVEVGP
jgi:hypothetical protein